MKCLVLEGKGVRRLDTVIWFFVLAAGYAWPGRLWYLQRPAKGRLQPWRIAYEGAYVDNYYRLLSQGHWKERIVVEDFDLEVGGPIPPATAS